jgi:hypothetical protein
MPRLLRVKTLIGTMAATLALAGAGQAVAPVSVLAQKRLSVEYCGQLWEEWEVLVQYKNWTAASIRMTNYENLGCDGVMTGL